MASSFGNNLRLSSKYKMYTLAIPLKEIYSEEHQVHKNWKINVLIKAAKTLEQTQLCKKMVVNYTETIEFYTVKKQNNILIYATIIDDSKYKDTTNNLWAGRIL